MVESTGLALQRALMAFVLRGSACGLDARFLPTEAASREGIRP
jgi:hypothetical protein